MAKAATDSNSGKQYFQSDIRIVLQALLQIAIHQVTKRFLTADHGKELFHKSGSPRMMGLTGEKKS